jgi:hypothetical protein
VCTALVEHGGLHAPIHPVTRLTCVCFLGFGVLFPGDCDASSETPHRLHVMNMRVLGLCGTYMAPSMHACMHACMHFHCCGRVTVPPPVRSLRVFASSDDNKRTRMLQGPADGCMQAMPSGSVHARTLPQMHRVKSVRPWVTVSYLLSRIPPTHCLQITLPATTALFYAAQPRSASDQQARSPWCQQWSRRLGSRPRCCSW